MLAELIVLSDEELVEDLYIKMKKCLEEQNYILTENASPGTTLDKTIGTKVDGNKKVVMMRSKMVSNK